MYIVMILWCFTAAYMVKQSTWINMIERRTEWNNSSTLSGQPIANGSWGCRSRVAHQAFTIRQMLKLNEVQRQYGGLLVQDILPMVYASSLCFCQSHNRVGVCWWHAPVWAHVLLVMRVAKHGPDQENKLTQTSLRWGSETIIPSIAKALWCIVCKVATLTKHSTSSKASISGIKARI